MDIELCDKIRPVDLLELQHKGHKVFRTAHVGNQYLSNMLLASIGIPLYLYDRNIFGRDTNYHPAFQILGGEKRELAPYLDLQNTVVPFGGALASFHYFSLKSIFGRLVCTESEVWLRQEDAVLKVFKSVAARAPSLFDRYILPCGCMVPLSRHSHQFGVLVAVGCRHELKEEFHLGLLEERAARLLYELRDLVTGDGAVAAKQGGAVPSIALVVVMDAIIGFLESGKEETYELSGPDMVRYVFSWQFKNLVQAAWRSVKYAKDEMNLPDSLKLYVVPTADFRFGYVKGHESEEYLAGCEELLKAQGEKRSRILEARKRGEDEMRLIEPFNERMSEIGRKLGDISWDIFYDIHQGNFFSHHDLASLDKPLVVSSTYLESPFIEISAQLRRLEQIIRRGNRRVGS